MKIIQPYNNFARGQLDHDLNGRFDLPIYGTGADIYENFLSNFKGNAIYRSGFALVDNFQDCRFIEFKFNQEQSYLCLFYAGHIKFLSYDAGGVLGFVQSGGVDLDISNPYTLAECKKLDFAQNSDVMYVTHKNHPPMKLTRVSASSFTFAEFTRTADPFLDTSTTSITIGTGSKTFTVTASKAYKAGQAIKIKYDASNYMVGTVTSYTTTSLVVNITSVVGSGTYASWTMNIEYPAHVCFYNGRLYYLGFTNRITTFCGSVAGLYDDFTIPATIDDDDALILTLSDISEEILWGFAGENSLIIGSRDGIVTVNGGSAGDKITANSVEATLTSAEGTSPTYPFAKDRAIFYISHTGRSILYFSYDILTESFSTRDANFVSYDITQGGISNLKWKKDRNDIIYTIRGDGDLVTLNLNSTENIIGFHQQITDGQIKDIGAITDNDGINQLFLLVERDSVFYIELVSPYVEFKKRTDFYTGVEADDDLAYKRYVSEQLRECNFLDNSECAYNLRTETITFDGTDTITSSGAVFSSGSVGQHIVYRSKTGYEYGRFEITGYTSTTEVTVNVLQTPSVNTYDSWFLTFTTISGLSRFIGKTVSFVTDGGYYDDVEITGSSYTFPDPVASVCVGYRYRGLIKSFTLGMQLQGYNSQVTKKIISAFNVRAVTTAGGKCGTSMYKLGNIQDLTPDTLNYLPPVPIDGTKRVAYTDIGDVDKCFYIVQDLPLPMNVTCVAIEVEHTAA